MLVDDMSVARVVVFGLIVGGGFVGLDYHLYRQQNVALANMGAAPHESYFDSLSQRVGSTVETTGATVLPAAHDLTDFLPAAPEGWTRAAYTEADGEGVTGRVYQRKPLPDNETDAMLGHLARPYDSGRVVTETYATGDAKVIVHISYRAPKTDKTFTGKIDAMVQDRLAGFSLGEPMPRFGNVQGVDFRQWPMTDRDRKTGDTFDVTYRRLVAGLGKAVDIWVVTNADDAAVQGILTGLNLPGLAALAGLGQGMVRADLAPVWGEAAEAVAVAATPVQQEPAPPEQEPAATEETSGKVCIRRAGVLECS